MKAKLDFDSKTIELEGEPTLDDIRQFQQVLQNWKEWRIISAAPLWNIPNVWLTPTWAYCSLCGYTHETGQACYPKPYTLISTGSAPQIQ